MDWIQIIATDPYWFQGLWLGGIGYAVFFEWKFVLAWVFGWFLMGDSDSAYYVPYSLGLLGLYTWYTVTNVLQSGKGRSQ